MVCISNCFYFVFISFKWRLKCEVVCEKTQLRALLGKAKNNFPNTQKLYKFYRSMEPHFIESSRKFSLLVSFLLTLRLCLGPYLLLLNWTIAVILYKTNAYFSRFFSFNFTCTLSLSFTSLFRTALRDFFPFLFRASLIVIVV